MNANDLLCQVVVDDDMRVLGTMTDGDVRRAILRGVNLDQPVTAAMNPNPVLGKLDDPERMARLQQVRGVIAFLPLVSAKGVLTEIVAIGRDMRRELPALVMAGGRGSRLGERTRDLPKPLLPVNGKPMIEHVVASLETAGTRRVFVAAHYLADQVAAWCATRKGVAELEVIHERAPCGTAGALGLLPDDCDGTVLVINADVVSNLDLTAFIAFHEHLDTDATIAVVRHEIEIPFGVVRSGEDGDFLGIDEKPKLSHFVAAGVYLIGPNVRAMVKRDAPLDMPELLGMARKIGLKVGVFPIHESWRDLGRPADLEAAERGMKTQILS